MWVALTMHYGQVSVTLAKMNFNMKRSPGNYFQKCSHFVALTKLQKFSLYSRTFHLKDINISSFEENWRFDCSQIFLRKYIIDVSKYFCDWLKIFWLVTLKWLFSPIVPSPPPPPGCDNYHNFVFNPSLTNSVQMNESLSMILNIQ